MHKAEVKMDKFVCIMISINLLLDCCGCVNSRYFDRTIILAIYFGASKFHVCVI